MKLERKMEYGDPKAPEQYPAWKHVVIHFTFIPAWIALWVSSLFAMLADFLLLDTHHIEISAKPKK